MVVVAVVDVGDDEDDDGLRRCRCAPSYARRPFGTTLGETAFFPVLNTPRYKSRQYSFRSKTSAQQDEQRLRLIGLSGRILNRLLRLDGKNFRRLGARETQLNKLQMAQNQATRVMLQYGRILNRPLRLDGKNFRRLGAGEFNSSGNSYKNSGSSIFQRTYWLSTRILINATRFFLSAKLSILLRRAEGIIVSTGNKGTSIRRYDSAGRSKIKAERTKMDDKFHTDVVRRNAVELEILSVLDTRYSKNSAYFGWKSIMLAAFKSGVEEAAGKGENGLTYGTRQDSAA
ncbi:hypothetical protein EAG_08670 [Camponotus floridanus]|uniref:Uncharacterized protein n=1 Tax=Camponotus floridanus TaxID=104421 RepID=E1ZVH2_CAMFO|nr:hypothetical protein EAG_08670 [Camponotus floridanus]